MKDPMKDERWIRVIADPEILKNKTIKISLFIRDMLDSDYVDNNYNLLSKEYDNMSDKSRRLTGTDGSRKTLAASQKEFIDLGIYEYAEEKKGRKKVPMIIYPPKDKFVRIYESTAEQLTAILSDNAIKVYIYLANQYFYWTEGRGQIVNFSKEQVYKEALGHTSEGGYNSDLIEDILTTLAVNGLITYAIIKKGHTYYRSLTYVNKRFNIHDRIQEGIKEMTEGLEEVSGDMVEDIEGEEEVLGTIGFIPSRQLSEGLPEIYITPGMSIQYRNVEDIAREKGESVSYILNQYGHYENNKPWVEYEKKRLGL